MGAPRRAVGGSFLQQAPNRAATAGEPGTSPGSRHLTSPQPVGGQVPGQAASRWSGPRVGEPTAPEQWALATGLQLTSPAHHTAVRRTHDDEATTGIDRTGQGAQTHSRGRSTVRMYGCTELRCTSRASRISCGEPRIKRWRIAAQQSAPWCRPRASLPLALPLAPVPPRQTRGMDSPNHGHPWASCGWLQSCVSVQPIHALSHLRPPAAAASPTQPSSRHLHLLSLCPGRAACRTACCSLTSVAPPLR